MSLIRSLEEQREPRNKPTAEVTAQISGLPLGPGGQGFRGACVRLAWLCGSPAGTEHTGTCACVRAHNKTSTNLTCSREGANRSGGTVQQRRVHRTENPQHPVPGHSVG